MLALAAALNGIPFGTLAYLPVVAAAFEGSRPARGSPPRTWIERVGLAAALGWALTLQARYRVQWYHETPASNHLTFEAINLASLLVEILLAAWLVRRFSPAWSRQFGVGYHGRGD